MTHTQPMACATCTVILNRYIDTTGAPTYVHPPGTVTAGTHRPVPVPAGQLDTLTQICDFCGDNHPLWTLHGADVAAIAVSHTGQTSAVNQFGDRWAACATCEYHITRGDIDAVTRRATATASSQVHHAVAELHHAFLRHLQPGRGLITTTRWPPTAITANVLPKTRDRLMALYHSDHDLPEHVGDHDNRIWLARQLARAKLYWIDPDFTRLAEHAAADLPPLAHTDVEPPSDSGLLIWAQPVTSLRIGAVSWTTGSDRQLTCYRSIGAGLDGPVLQHLREQAGWLLPTHLAHHHPGGHLTPGDPAAVLAATWLLISQHIGETVPATVDRAIGRAYARTNRPKPEVRLVRIKPRAPTTATVRTTSERLPMRDRRWVGGHWKHQAHGPGRSQRRLIYINEYLRGPEDAPITTTNTVRVLADSTTTPPTMSKAYGHEQ